MSSSVAETDHRDDDVDSRYGRSLEANLRASTVIPGGTNSVFRPGDPCPLTFVRAAGSHLTDIDGNDYVDYALGMGPLILGHGPKAVNDAVSDALGHGQLFAGQHPLEYDVAELLLAAIPWAERVRFGQSGTEMDQVAVRLARAFTGRQRIVRFAGHYHGWLDPLYMDPETDGSMPWPGLSFGQSRASASDVIVLPWNDETAIRAVLESTDRDVAAVIMEPILCNTGVIPPSPGYAEGVRELCDRTGTVLIFDEVITGFRVGLTGAQGMLGIRPDLATFAKAIASGFPVAAIAGRADILDQLQGGRVVHGGTYNTGVTAMAAARATLDILVNQDPYPKLVASGESLMEGIGAVAREVGVDLVVEGFGPVFHTRFGPPVTVTDLRSFRDHSNVAARRSFVRALQDRGVRITPRGTWFLSTEHSADDIELTVQATKSALLAVADAGVLAGSTR